MYTTQSENSISNFKILNSAHINPERVKYLLYFTVPLMVSEITANSGFQGHVTLRVM